MNARLLTALFLLCSVAIAKTVMQPQLQELAMAKGEGGRLILAMASVNKSLGFMSQFDQTPAPKLGIDKVVVQSISRMLHTHHDFGVVMTDVSAGTTVGGQNVIPMQSMQTQNAATGLMSQELNIKGSYESLEDFQNFIQTQIIEHGGSVSVLNLRGYSFEMKVQLFGPQEELKAGV